jgi:hypothetical protein
MNIYYFLSLIIPILSVAQKTIKVSYEQKFIYNDSFLINYQRTVGKS